MMPKMHVAFADSYEPSGPFGAKGLGEIASRRDARDHANAIADAVGVRIPELPITAEKVFWGMQEARHRAGGPDARTPNGDRAR